ncbi:MAG: hypothetical protein LBR98_04375 [Syntrophomonadaceae bacterium]|jgi:hypothetical protein|nr:hypothetical protein [Syntrophomonadaceae bacterium]
MPKARKVSALAFLKDKRALSFLVLILTPFLIGLAFRDYFFPIYASKLGISEADVGPGQQHLPVIRTIHGEDFYAIVIESHKKYMMHCLDLKH